MKTPRFFIAFAVCAVAFTIASSLVAPVVRESFAGPLPILRVDPRMGDPDLPGVGYEIPFDESYELSRTPDMDVQSAKSSARATRRPELDRIHHLLKILIGRRW